MLHREMGEKHSDETWFTTMLDLYALPDDFPDLPSAPPRPGERVRALQAAFKDDIVTKRLWRFTPDLQLHEDEALLLTDVAVIARSFPDAAAEAAAALKADVAGLAPEEVDGGRGTAPSKRIIRHFPSYAGLKASVGPVVASDIGVQRLKAVCPHFADWLDKLEQCCRA